MGLGKEFLPMNKDGRKLAALKSAIGINKIKEKPLELCEVHIIGTPELILKLMGKN